MNAYESSAEKMAYYRNCIDSILIYNAQDDAIIQCIRRLAACPDEELPRAYSALFRKLAGTGQSLKEYLTDFILTDDNIFTKAAAGRHAEMLEPEILDAVKSDLAKLEIIGNFSAEDVTDAAMGETERVLLTLPEWDNGCAKEPLSEHWDTQIGKLTVYHETHGYGMYARYGAFTWRDRALVPITNTNPIDFSKLKNYARQQEQIRQNTEAFLQNSPANNVLLYGDRGTGKSSTVHALLNTYRTQGLRIIEIKKADIAQLTEVREAIADSPMKFIIFIDDLTFDAHDDSFGELKAALEGSITGRQANTLIYATSNRRHLIKENHSDRENDVHRSDTMQEELSLSDRFGLTVTYLNPDRQEYLDITLQLAQDAGIDEDTERLLLEAENWARRRGGRSPRCAKQFIDYVIGCRNTGMEW